MSEDAVGVAIAAAPTDGEANAELLRYLAQVLQLKKRQVALDKVPHARQLALISQPPGAATRRPAAAMRSPGSGPRPFL